MLGNRRRSWTVNVAVLVAIPMFALDIEYNPYGKNICYGLTRRAMVAWVSGFARTVHRRTSRWPVIYTTANWWASCTGDSAVAGKRSPLWIASWNNRRRPTRLPHGWRTYTFWQYANHGEAPGDQDVFRGSNVELRSFATGGQRTPPKPPVAPPPARSPTLLTPTSIGRWKAEPIEAGKVRRWAGTPVMRRDLAYAAPILLPQG